MTGSTGPDLSNDGLRLRETVLLAGAGNMGGALLEAWLAGGLDPRRLAVVDPRPSSDLVSSLSRNGIALNPAADARPKPDVLVLAVKPQILGDAVRVLSHYVGPETLLISVVAGKQIVDLRRLFPSVQAVARAMPNTPAAVRKGITGVAVNENVGPGQRDTIRTLFEAVGQVEWLASEPLIDVVTAVSGSGPAYVFYLTECLAKAGERAGLDAGAALRLARATVEGAGALLSSRPDGTPGDLRRNVTSPGGTTAAALDVLMRDPGLQDLMAEAVAAAAARARDLSA